MVEGKVIAGSDVDAPYFGTEMKLEGLVCLSSCGAVELAFSTVSS